MRLAVFDDYRIGVVQGSTLCDVTDLLAEAGVTETGMQRMTGLIARLDAVRPILERVASGVPVIPISRVHLRPAIPAPRDILAAPKNYRSHADEMAGPLGSGDGTILDLGFFLKATGSISGPDDPIELPRLAGREFHHEAEVAFVIGKQARAVNRDAALDYVAGYSLLVDVTMRNSSSRREERSMRKSFASFTPLGPYLLTADEVPDPARFRLKLWVNGEKRQNATLKDLIVDIPGLIEQASSVVTLQPGDVFATGTPAGVGQIHPGDEVAIEVEEIGRMRLPVVQRSW